MKLLTLATAALLLQAPSAPPAPSPSAFLEGTVTGPDGPLAGVEVTAFWDPPPVQYQPETLPRTYTSVDGSYSIPVSPGGYRVTASAPGYVRQEFGAALAGTDGAGTGTVLRPNPGDRIRNLDIRLSADSIVAGRITSTDGQPLVRMEVAILKRRFFATGVSQLEFRGRVETNDRGEYRVAGLPPGEYYVRAASMDPARFRLEQTRSRIEGTAAPAPATPGFFAPVYYPRAGHFSRASLVQVVAGAETRNIDFVLSRQQAYTIRGRVTDASTGGPPAQAPAIGAWPAYYDYPGNVSSSIEPYKPDGTFEIQDITPGYYWVRAQRSPSLTAAQRQLLSTPGGNTSELPLPVRGIALVQVVDSDVGNVELTMVRDLELPGRLTVEGESFDVAANAGSIRLELRPVDVVGNGAPVRFTLLDGTGAIVYRRILPMEHRLTVSALPPGFYVKAARLGRIDALTDSLLLTKPLQDELEIVLARGTEVRGSVTPTSAAGAIANQEVVLVPDQLSKRPDLYRTAKTDANGGFVIQGVAPGNYRLFAWSRIESFQYFDDVFVSRNPDTGIPVIVSEGQILRGLQVPLQ